MVKQFMAELFELHRQFQNCNLNCLSPVRTCRIANGSAVEAIQVRQTGADCSGSDYLVLEMEAIKSDFSNPVTIADPVHRRYCARGNRKERQLSANSEICPF
jgi:hypothetical protein